jgi:hypothetical protein
MSVIARPIDTITKENLFIGYPIVLFERLLSSGSYDVPRNLGIVDAAELQTIVGISQLRNQSSGVSVIEREVVRQLEPSLVFGIFNFEPENMRLFLASSELTSLSPSTVVVTDNEYVVPNDTNKFGVLSNRNLTTPALTDLTFKTITAEDVGTGDGTLGAVSGEYALDHSVAAVGDVTGLTVAGVAFTPIAVGAAAAGNEVEVVVGASGTSGNLQFFVGGAPSDVTGAIAATYTPSHALVNGTDYLVDPYEGRVRMLFGSGEGAEFKVDPDQILLADYSYARFASTQMRPFTQSTFEGRATIQQLTEGLGVNYIWTVPVVSIRVNDEAFSWSAEDFAVGSLTMNILSDPSSVTAPYGTFIQYPETP